MDNIKKIFNKKNMKIIIPAIVLLVLLIVLFIYLREYKLNNYRDKQDKELYQYVTNNKIEYTATISYNKKNVIKGFVPKEYSINYDSTPIYFKEESKVILPKDMAIILPLKRLNQYKTTEFTYIEKINNIYKLVNDNYNKNIDHFIMYDGNYLYLFSDEVTFKINNETITLSPLSYIIAKPDSISYYNYKDDTYNIINKTENLTVYSDYYSINVNYGKLEISNDFMLFTNNLDYLMLLKEN